VPKVGWGYGKRTFIGMVLDDAFAPFPAVGRNEGKPTGPADSGHSPTLL